MFFKFLKTKFLSLNNLVLLFSFLALSYALFGLFQGEFFDSHDSVFHLTRVVEFNKTIKSGQFPVRWAPDLVNGLGIPVFNYFYPLFYYLTVPLVLLGVSAAAACKIILVLAYFFGFLFAWKFLYHYFRSIPSLIGAFLYVFAPYMFLDLYVRGNFAEFLALMMVPAIFWAGDNIIRGQKRILSILILAFFILSHNIIVMLAVVWLFLFIFANLIYDFFRINGKEEKIDFIKNNSKRIFIFVALALGLAAFFWLPALSEISLTHLADEKVYSWADHFPTIRQLIYSSWDYGHSLSGPGDYMSFQIGPMHLLLVVGSVLAFIFSFWQKRKLTKKEFLYLFFFFSFIGLVFLMNSRSAFIWRYISVLSRAQFPWRLLGFALFAVIFLAAFFLEKIFRYLKNKKSAKIIVVIAIYFLVFRSYYDYLKPKIYISVEKALSSDHAKGTTATSNELLPIWVPKEKPRKISLEKTINCQLFQCQTETNFKEENDVVFRKFYFPGWYGFIDNQAIALHPQDKTGLIKITVPAGQHNILLKLQQTKIEKLANLISLISLMILLILRFKYYRHEKNP